MKQMLAGLLLMLSCTVSFASDHADTGSNALISKSSPYSVAETMDRFVAILEEKGLGIFARIDHQQNAQGVDMDMNPAQVVIFGNPKAGTALLQKDVAVALDLPMRVAVYETDTGDVKLAYHDPAQLAELYQLQDHPVLTKLTAALDKLTAAAIAE